MTRKEELQELVEFWKRESRLDRVGFLRLKRRIQELEGGIREVLDGTLPYLAEKRLKELLDGRK